MTEPTGSRDTAQRYVLQDDLCHGFFINSRLTYVMFYLADHAECECLITPGRSPSSTDSTWFCTAEDPSPPPEGTHNAWRYLLRTASLMSVLIRFPAFCAFVHAAPSAAPCRPDSFLTAFEALAQQARHAHAQLPEQPGMFHLTVDDQLWTVQRHENPNRKPQVLNIQHVDHFTGPVVNHSISGSAPQSARSLGY